MLVIADIWAMVLTICSTRWAVAYDGLTELTNREMALCIN